MVDKCYFLALLRVDTHLLLALWNDLRLPSIEYAFQEEKGSYLKAIVSPHDSVSQGKEDWYDNCRQDGTNLCISESLLLWRNSNAALNHHC